MRSAFLFLREVPAIITYHICIVFHLASSSEVLYVILFVIFYHLIGAPKTFLSSLSVGVVTSIVSLDSAYSPIFYSSSFPVVTAGSQRAAMICD